VLDHFLDYLWGDKPSSEKCIGNLVSFPFLPWFTFPLVGMFLGDTLIMSTDIRRTFKKVGIAGCVLLIVSLAFLIHNPAYHVNDYYHGRPAFVAFTVGIVLAWLGICHFIVNHIRMNALFSVLYGWSRNVTSFYIIQWILIMVGADAVFGFYKSSYLTTISVMIAITIASHYATKLYLWIKAKPLSALPSNFAFLGKERHPVR
jgi:hypothetical protein